MKETQHDKIKELYTTQEWACQIDFWKISKSPHTRRREITEEGRYYFKERPCVHGHKRIYDYTMVENETYKPESKKRVVFVNNQPTLVFQ